MLWANDDWLLVVHLRISFFRVQRLILGEMLPHLMRGAEHKGGSDQRWRMHALESHFLIARSFMRDSIADR